MPLSPSKVDSITVESLFPDRALQIKETILRAQLIGIMANRGEILPAASSAVSRLWQLLYSDETTVEQCVEVIELDPSLASRVFRFANSGVYIAKARSLKDAVIFLGFSRLRQVVFSDGIFAQFSKMKLPEEWEHFWLRNVLISRLVERISADFFRPTGTEFLAGLIHDTGLVLMASSFSKELEQVMASSLPFHEAEMSVFSFNHGDVSAMICARSNFPARVVYAMQQHQVFDLSPLPEGELPKDSARLLGAILYIADRLATSAGMPLIEGDVCSLPQLLHGGEYRWLVEQGLKSDLKVIVDEEMPKAKEVYAIFFGK